MVLHAGPVVVRLEDPLTGPFMRHVVHGLVEQKVRLAELWIRELEPQKCEQWRLCVAAILVWLGSRGLKLRTITVSNLGLEGEDGTLWLFDPGLTVSLPAWLPESGLESYTVLQVVQSRQAAGVQGHGNSPGQPASYGQNVGPSEIGRRGSLACVPKEAGHPAGGWRPSVDFNSVQEPSAPRKQEQRRNPASRRP